MPLLPAAFAAVLVLATLAAPAQPEQRAQRLFEQRREASREQRPVALPAGAIAIRDIAYGDDPAQHFDLYLPARTTNAPVVFHVHGGGWANGDKTNPGLAAKLAHWLPKGYAVISSNYRTLPGAMPLEQARDIAMAVATAQRRAREWQLDAGRFVLMGHSAGAHLVALLGADPAMLAAAGAHPVLGVVSLDSGALDVPALMGQRRVPKLYRAAFGDDPGDWRAGSPLHRLGRGSLPMLLVCAEARTVPTSPCAEARRFAQRAGTLGRAMVVQPEPLDHGQINRELGQPSAYTRAVSAWIDDAVESSTR